MNNQFLSFLDEHMDNKWYSNTVLLWWWGLIDYVLACYGSTVLKGVTVWKVVNNM